MTGVLRRTDEADAGAKDCALSEAKGMIKNMEQIRGRLREKALLYVQEAFVEHKEEIFLAMNLVCQSGGGPGLITPEEWIALWEEEGKTVPLKEALLAVMKMAEAEKDPEGWAEELYGLAVRNGYSGYEWYLTYIYLAGMRSADAGVFSEWNRLVCRMMVPEQWQEDYDSYWREWKEKEQEEEAAEGEQILNGHFREAALITEDFHRCFEKMEPKVFKGIVRETDYKTLSVAVFGAEEPLKSRFLENMSGHQKELVQNEWSRYYAFDEFRLNGMLAAMIRMRLMAGLAGEG